MYQMKRDQMGEWAERKKKGRGQGRGEGMRVRKGRRKHSFPGGWVLLYRQQIRGQAGRAHGAPQATR